MSVGSAIWLTSCLAASSLPAKEELPFLREGKLQVAVVRAPAATRSAQLAVHELVHHVKQATGQTLPVFDSAEKVPRGITPVYVGESPDSRSLGLVSSNFAPQHSLIRITPEYIALIGRDDPESEKVTYEKNGAWPGFNTTEPFYELGTLHATYNFLEEFLGVRWYMVTELGTVIPSWKNLNLPTVEKLESPWAKYRQTSRNTWQILGEIPRDGVAPTGASERDNILFLLRSRIGGQAYGVNHSFNDYYTRFGSLHPEWFVGKPGPDIQLKYLDAAVQGQILHDARDFFQMPMAQRLTGQGAHRAQKVSRGDYFSLVPMDNRDFGEAASSLLQPNRKNPERFGTGVASNYIFTFVNAMAGKIATEYPDAWVSAIAYADTFEPPDFSLNPNVAVTVCMADGWSGYGMDTLEGWRRKVSRLLVWEYLHDSFDQLPSVRPLQIGDYIAKLRQMGVYGWFSEMPGIPYQAHHRNPALYHLNAYMIFRMLRDSAAEPEAILNEYYHLFYGPAEAPLRRFWKTLIAISAKFEKKGLSAWTDHDLDDALKSMATDLNEAETMVPKNSPYEQRIKYLRVGILDTLTQRLNHFRKVLEEPSREITLPMGRKISNFLDNTNPTDWQNFTKTDRFVHLDGSKTQVATWARLARDEDSLYVAIECEEPRIGDLVANQTSPSAGICTDDSVEVMLAPGDRDPKTYLHLMINTKGLLWCRWTKKWNMNDLSAEEVEALGLQSAVQIYEDRYVVKVIIPMRLLTESTETEWRLGLFRNCLTTGKAIPGRLDSDRWLTWNPTLRWGFNEPSRLGHLHLPKP